MTKSKNMAMIILFLILALAFFIRMVYAVCFSPAVPQGDPYYYDRTAQSIVRGEGYRNGNLYAYLPPAYGYFLAGVYGIFGHNYEMVKIIQVCLGVATCLIIYLLTECLLGRSAGLFAATVFAFYPQLVRYPGELWTETLFIFLFSLSLYLIYQYMLSRKYWMGIIAGIFLGLSALTREIALSFLILIALWMFICLPKPVKITVFIKHFGIFFVATMLVILPWTIRNYAVFGKVVPISTNAGINFYIGNNPNANGGFSWHVPDGAEWPDNIKNTTQKQLKYLELHVARQGFEQGMLFVKNNPKNTIALMVKKFFYLWRAPYYDIDMTMRSSESIFRIAWLVAYIGIIALAIPAMAMTLIARNSRWLLLHFWILHITIIHLLTYGGTRYRLPAIPILIVFAAFTVHRMILRIRKVRAW